jgi:hypothetical protein
METAAPSGHNQRENPSRRESIMSDALSSPEKWAARTLGLPEGIDEPTARSSFLGELARDGFVPPLSRQIAWATLRDPQATPPDAARRAAEVRLSGEIDDFAAEFFALPPTERGRQWQALAARAAGTAPLAARLAALEPGLHVVPPSEGDPKVLRLAAGIASLFVLAPLARAAQRQAMFSGMKADMTGWETAARVLRKSAPALAALDPQLMDAIKSWQKLQGRLEQARAGTRPRARSTPKAAVAAPTPSGSSQLPVKTLIWIGIVVIGGGVRVCSGLGSHSSNSTPPPRFEQPRVQPIDFQKQEELRKVLEDVERQNEEDRKRAQKRWEDAPRQIPHDDPPGRVKGFGTAAEEKPRKR